MASVQSAIALVKLLHIVPRKGPVKMCQNIVRIKPNCLVVIGDGPIPVPFFSTKYCPERQKPWRISDRVQWPS